MIAWSNIYFLIDQFASFNSLYQIIVLQMDLQTNTLNGLFSQLIWNSCFNNFTNSIYNFLP